MFWALFISVVGYALGIIFDIMYIKTQIFAFHIAYWIFLLLGFSGSIISIASQIKHRNKNSDSTSNDSSD